MQDQTRLLTPVQREHVSSRRRRGYGEAISRWLVTLLLSCFAAQSAQSAAEEACFRAIYSLKANNLDAAIELYTQCLRGDLTDSNRIVALNDRGNAYGRRGDHTLALKDFDAVITLKPDDPDAYYNRGLTYRRMNQLENAAADYGNAIQLAPGYAKAYNNRGAILGRQGQFGAAIEDFNKTLSLAPQTASAIYNRGLAYYSQSQFALAITDFQNAIELDDSYGKAYAKLAWLRATCPDPEFRDGPQAVSLARKARILRGKGTSELYDVLAAAYAAAGKYDEAVKYQELAIELSDRPATAPRKLRLQRFAGKLQYEDAAGNQFEGET